jgi:hypothetical protein
MNYRKGRVSLRYDEYTHLHTDYVVRCWPKLSLVVSPGKIDPCVQTVDRSDNIERIFGRFRASLVPQQLRGFGADTLGVGVRDVTRLVCQE